MFYLQAPDINVSILDVEDSAMFRFKHFSTYTRLSDKPEYVKYLRNSTLLDYAGFLCLRFDIIDALNTKYNIYHRTHASLTDDSTLKQIIIEGECYLITERLRLLKPNFLRKYLIKILEDIQLFSVVDDNISILQKVCLEYKNKQHEPCSEHCHIQSIKVPWQKCPTLVSDHKVHLVEGIAIVPCSQWNNLLVDLFRLIYIKSLHCIRRSTSALAENNLQVRYLSDKINWYYNTAVALWKDFNGEMSLEELNLQRSLLPPCMLLSLNSLFKNHRLAHDPRYRLTLFLKDIGVPLDQTLMLFKKEYSKCGNLGSTCTHSWEDHCKRIEYNVRHTYGTLGSKKNYKMTSCILMQKQNNQLSDEGGCPFVHCSQDKLKNILEECTPISDVDMNILNDLKNSDKPICACHWYAHKLCQTSQTLYHNTPTEYFFNLKKATS